jgi:hypothetical protein
LDADVSYPGSPPGSLRIPLYSRPSRASVTVFRVVGVLFLLWLLAGLAFPSAGVYFVGLFAWLLIFTAVAVPVIWHDAWLDGTRLVVRGPLASRDYDLSACAVQLTADPKTGLPVLAVQDAATGRRVGVLLREPKEKVLVSPQKLRALASAVTARGPRDAAAGQAAGQMAWLADNWPGTPSPQLR